MLRAKQATNGSPDQGLLHEEYEEEWDHVVEAWRDGDYDLVLFWWLM